MKTLYFDLIGGISGDMTTAAFLDFGVSFEYLKAELKKVKINGYFLKKSYVERGHIKAVKFDVDINPDFAITKSARRADRLNPIGFNLARRGNPKQILNVKSGIKEPKNYSYQQILRIIKSSRLSVEVKNNIFKVYKVLCDAETKVHGHKHEDISFEQLGDIDSIVDIASVCICLDKIGVCDIFYSLIPLNKKIAPATFELLKDKKVYFTDSIYENVTPTGIAILSALGKQMEDAVKNTFKIGASGYGAGLSDSVEVSNVLRIAELKNAENSYDTDEIQVVEANIDDMNPQFFEYVFERLFEAGAYDVFIKNIYMKKTRPGFLLTVLSKAENLGKIADIILSETTSSGIRFYPAQRLKLQRQIKELKFKGEKIRIKEFQLSDGSVRLMPEYEDCKVLARKTKIPISKIYNELKKV